MAFDITTHFEQYEVTNGKYAEIKAGQVTAAVPIGCTGSIEIETEVTPIQKRCEGKVTKEVTRVEKLTGTFTGHMPVEVLRKVFGLTNEGLKEGVYAYGTTSVGGNAALTWDVYDMTRENKKLIAFPNVSFTSGLKFSLENGGDEVAEIELEFSAMADKNGVFYYEGFEDDLDSNTKRTWSTKFTSEGVLKPTSTGA